MRIAVRTSTAAGLVFAVAAVGCGAGAGESRGSDGGSTGGGGGSSIGGGSGAGVGGAGGSGGWANGGSPLGGTTGAAGGAVGGATSTGGAAGGASAATWVPATQDASVTGYFLNAIDSRLYLQHGNSIFTSADDGTTWTPTGPVLPDTYAGNFLAIVDQYYFLSFGSEGVLRALPDDSQWILLSSGLPSDIYVYGLVRVGGTVLAGTNHGVFASSDNGENWIPNNSDPLDSTLLIPRIIAVGTTLFLATNRGDSFRGTPIDSGYAWMEELMRVPYAIQRKGSSLFSASLGNPVGNQIPRVTSSQDDGVTWAACESGILSGGVTRQLEVLGPDLFVGAAFYAGETPSPFIVYRSSNDGASWTPAMEGLPDGVFINSWAVSGNYLVAATNSHGLWRIARDPG